MFFLLHVELQIKRIIVRTDFGLFNEFINYSLEIQQKPRTAGLFIAMPWRNAGSL
ncbi:hypothetical protein SAMN05216323_106520 [Williamwhitmania taraxaci]|uniref:Uncharacterized protein n=1 Tax=Williamwhitmania taraxaci TaxID=1640674 RepID=A0A1G6QSQ8_9BACT|nr:hypothetical protein SAMN05216323_106520 [Williamwhitmania taraxaci]